MIGGAGGRVETGMGSMMEMEEGGGMGALEGQGAQLERVVRSGELG